VQVGSIGWKWITVVGCIEKYSTTDNQPFVRTISPSLFFVNFKFHVWSLLDREIVPNGTLSFWNWFIIHFFGISYKEHGVENHINKREIEIDFGINNESIVYIPVHQLMYVAELWKNPWLSPSLKGNKNNKHKQKNWCN